MGLYSSCLVPRVGFVLQGYAKFLQNVMDMLIGNLTMSYDVCVTLSNGAGYVPTVPDPRE